MERSTNNRTPIEGTAPRVGATPSARSRGDDSLSSLTHPSGHRVDASDGHQAQSMTLKERQPNPERSAGGRCAGGVRSISAAVAQHPHRIIDAVGASLAATATVAAATASGGAVSLSDILLGLSAAAVTLASLDYGERVSVTGPISVTTPLRNWGEGFITHLKWCKEAFDDDGPKVCLGALAMSFCSKLPGDFYPSVGVTLGALYVACSSTFLAALRCGVGVLALPLAATATLSRAVAKPFHDLARWMSR